MRAIVISSRKKYLLISNATVQNRPIYSHLEYFVRNFIADPSNNSIATTEDDSRSADNIITEVEVNSSMKKLQKKNSV